MKFMKTRLAILALLSTFSLQPSALHAQGALTPPGAPAPTMKTLAQIEARTPIASVPFTIAASGSYYLTTNLTVSSGNAITVSANNVALDLNGFTLASTENPAALGYGIKLNSVTNITIVNGFISGGVTNNGGVYGGSGFAYGILSVGSYPVNARVSGVSVSGCRYMGIGLGYNNTVVESCTVNTVGSYGISAQMVSDSTALNCGNTGVSATTANNCSGTSSGSGDGIYATAIATGCYGYSASGTGVHAFIASVCHGETSSGTALLVTHNVNSF